MRAIASAMRTATAATACKGPGSVDIPPAAMATTPTKTMPNS